MAGGYSGSAMLQQLKPRGQFGEIAAPGRMTASTPGAAVQAAQNDPNESATSLQNRYGKTPETVGQWNTMNGFNQKQQDGGGGFAPANPTAPHLSNGQPQPTQPQTPLGTPPPGQGPAGSAVSSGLQGILDQINKVYEGQNKVAMDESQRAMANRGLGRGDAAGNAIYNDAIGRVGASKSNAVMQAMLSQQGVDAQNQRFQQEMALKEKMMQADQQRLAQQMEFERNQASLSQTNWQKQFDANSQQRNITNINSGVTDQSGQAILPGATPGGAAASAMTGGGQPSFFDLLAGSNALAESQRAELQSRMASSAPTAGGASLRPVPGGLPGFGNGLPSIGTGAGTYGANGSPFLNAPREPFSPMASAVPGAVKNSIAGATAGIKNAGATPGAPNPPKR